MKGGWRDRFESERERLNGLVLDQGNLGIKRFFALDNQAYEDGELDSRTKELLGLTASLVLRCDDCVAYHLARCHDAGITKEQLYEAFNIALIVGGSIVIPHLRRAADKLEEIGR